MISHYMVSAFQQTVAILSDMSITYSKEMVKWHLFITEHKDGHKNSKTVAMSKTNYKDKNSQQMHLAQDQWVYLV